MTDDQWVWLFINQAIDYEEKFEGMCDKCKTEVTSGKKTCTRCGKVVSNAESFINPNFDQSKFDRANGNDYDIELLNQIREGDNIAYEETDRT